MSQTGASNVGFLKMQSLQRLDFANMLEAFVRDLRVCEIQPNQILDLFQMDEAFVGEFLSGKVERGFLVIRILSDLPDYAAQLSR